MVFYFTSNTVSPAAFLYMGKDKVENEDLIKFGWDEDFHVDNLSSAHVYLRLKKGESWELIPDELLEDCAQLTKANSIEGNKKDNITIIYTPWSNLLKNSSMATGQVSFRDHKLTRKVHVPARVNPIVNRLNKTKTEQFPDLHAEREENLREKRQAERRLREERKAGERREKQEREQLRYQKEHAYDDLMDEDEIAKSSNQDRNADFLEDFM